MHSLRFLINAQINYDKYVSQKTALHSHNLLTKRWMACLNILEIAPGSLVR